MAQQLNGEAALHERIAFLEEENLQLKAALKLMPTQDTFEAFRRTLGLAPQEATLLCLLFDRYPNMVGHDLILHKLYDHKYGADAGPDDGLRVIKVLVSKTRAKIGKHCIKTQYSSYGLSDGGYILTKAGHDLAQGVTA